LHQHAGLGKQQIYHSDELTNAITTDSTKITSLFPAGNIVTRKHWMVKFNSRTRNLCKS